MVSREYVKKHIHNANLQMCFFYAYLLNFKTSKIKANTTIVSAIKPIKSNCIIVNKIASIICTTSVLVTLSYGLKVANTHLFILISYGENITYKSIHFNTKIKKILLVVFSWQNGLLLFEWI